MFKRIMLMISLLSVVLLTFANSFTFAFDINDYIEVEQGDMPTEANSDVQLFDNSEDNNADSSDLLDINDDYYDEDHLAEGEEENVESFDTKVEYFTLDDDSDNDSESDSSTQTSDESDSDIVSYDFSSSDDEAETSSDDSGIMLLSDDDYEEDENISSHSVYDSDNYKWDFNIDSNNTPVPISTYAECEAILVNGLEVLIDNEQGDYLDYQQILDIEDTLITEENLVIFKYFDGDGVCRYNFFFTCGDIEFTTNDNGYSFNCTTGPSICFRNFGYYTGRTSSSYGTITRGTFRYVSSVYVSFGDGGGLSSSGGSYAGTNSYSVIYSGGHSLYVDGEKADVINEEGFLDSNLTGKFIASTKSKTLSYQISNSSKEDVTYDIHLFALDGDASVPITFGNESYIVDLQTFNPENLQIDCSNICTIGGSMDLELVYYYLHQMTAYDSSLESVDGYDFNAFDNHDYITFALAFREVNSSGDWTTITRFCYDYSSLLSSLEEYFTVKKDYVDFPDMDDYIEEFPEFSEYLDEQGEDPDIFDYVVAGFKWIGACIKVLGHNFIGFFKWLIDCIPILWENLTIALYNLVCDLKSLFLYLFNPKVNSILQMAEERVPGLTSFLSAAQNGNAATLPSFTIFGAKFSLDLSDYDLPWNYLKSFSQVIIMILFAVGTYNLIAHVFGFVKIDNVEDTSDDE